MLKFTYVVWPDSVKFFKTKGEVKVKGSILTVIKKEFGDTVLVKLTEKID